jgi:hypothetical protein
MNSSTQTIELTGLDGSNPLAFLAALGALRCLDFEYPEPGPRMSWSDHLHPAINSHVPMSPSGLVELLHRTVRRISADGAAALGDIIGVPAEQFRRFADPHGGASPRDRLRLLFASAYGSDAVRDARKGTIIPSALSFSNGQGGKLLLKDFRTLADRLTVERLHAALFEPWRYDDTDEPMFRWDPLDMRTGAHMATDPGSTETRSMMAANALAFVGLSFVTTAPRANQLLTSGFRPIDGESHFVWQLWQAPVGADVVACMLQQPQLHPACGILATFASQRIMYKKNLYLGPSFAI